MIGCFLSLCLPVCEFTLFSPILLLFRDVMDERCHTINTSCVDTQRSDPSSRASHSCIEVALAFSTAVRQIGTQGRLKCLTLLKSPLKPFSWILIAEPAPVMIQIKHCLHPHASRSTSACSATQQVRFSF